MGCGCSVEDATSVGDDVGPAERVERRSTGHRAKRSKVPVSPLVAHITHMKMESKVIRARRRNDAKHRQARRSERKWARQAAAFDLLLPVAAPAHATSTLLTVAPETILTDSAVSAFDRTKWLLGTLGSDSAFLETAEATQRRVAAQIIQDAWRLRQHSLFRASRRKLASVVLGAQASPATILAHLPDGRPLRLQSPFRGQQRQSRIQAQGELVAAAEEAAEAAALLGDGEKLGAIFRAVALDDYNHASRRLVGETGQGGELTFTAGETVWVFRAPLYAHWFGCTAATAAAAAKHDYSPVKGQADRQYGSSGDFRLGGTFPSDAVKVYDVVGLEHDRCYLLSVDQGLELGRCSIRECALALRENVALEMRGGGWGCTRAVYAVGDLYASLSPNGMRAYADPEAWMKTKHKHEQLHAQRAPLGQKWCNTDVGMAQAAAVLERNMKGASETTGDRIGAAFESGWFRDSVSDGMDNGMSHVEWIGPALDLLSIKSGDIVMEWGYCVGHAVVRALASLEKARQSAGQQPDDRIAALIDETDALKAELAELKEQRENELAIQVAEKLGASNNGSYEAVTDVLCISRA
jgi:hypothetical protein